MSTPRGSRSANFVIRPAGPSDVEALVELMLAFYAESNFPLDRAWSSGAFHDLLRQPELGMVWLATHDERPLGHVVLSVRYTMEYGGLSGIIDDLYVVPTARRRGIGAALLNALRTECRSRGCRSIQVEVGADNTSALALYSRIGLRAANDGRLVMRLALDQAPN